MKFGKIKGIILLVLLFLCIGGLTSCSLLDSSSEASSTTETEKHSDNKDDSEKQNNSYFVKVHIDFSVNIFMDIYDMDLFLDGDFIETIPHGEDQDYTFELKYGKHTLKVMNAPEDSYDKECVIDVKDNISTTLYLKGHDGYMEFYQKNVTTIAIHNISYNLNDGVNNEKNPKKFMSSDSAKLYPATKENYDFKGWSYNGKIISSIPKGINDDITLDAIFEPTQFEIKYNVDGATHTNPTTYTIESEIVLNAATKDGATFINWTDSKGNVITKIEKGTTGNLVLTANFEYEKYSITYNFNKGTYNGTLKDTYTSSDSFELPKPEKEYYTFVAWIDSNGKAITRIEKGTVGDLVLTAKYVEKEYTISYSLNGGVNDSANPTKYTISSSSFKLNDAKKYKSTFVGWYLNSDFSGTAITDINALNSNLSTIKNVTLYAKFESDYSFDLAYSAINTAGEVLYVMLDTSKNLIKQFDTSTNKVNTGMYTGDLNSSEYLYSLALNFTFVDGSLTGSLYRTTSSLTSDCILLLSNYRVELKHCLVSNAIKYLSSINVVETNESIAALPENTPVAGYYGSTTKSGIKYNYFMYIDIKNNSWKLIGADSTYETVVTLGSGTLENYKENDTYISFYTMDTFGTVTIYKNNLEKMYNDSAISSFTRGQ